MRRLPVRRAARCSLVGSRVEADGPAKLPTPRAAAGLDDLAGCVASPELLGAPRRWSLRPAEWSTWGWTESTRVGDRAVSILALKDGRSWSFAERPRERPGAGVGGRDALCGSRLRAFGPRRRGRRRPGRPPPGLWSRAWARRAHAADGPDDFSAGGLRLGMDGRLYIAVGDRGIFHAVGKGSGGASSFRAEE